MAKKKAADQKKEDVEKTTTRPKSGKGAMNGLETGRPFSKENQPDPKRKSEGAKRHWVLRDLLNKVTGQKFEGSAKVYRDLCARYFQIEPSQVTVKMIMDFRQIERAILKGDTTAYKAITDRAYGRPREEQAPIVDIPTDTSEATKFILPGGIEFEI